VQNVRVEVSADDNRCIDLLEQTFGFLLAQREFEQKGAAISVWIHSAAQQRYSVHYGSTTVHDCRLDQVPPVVHAAIFLAYYDNNFRFLAFHSAAVCAGRQLIILPGKSGSGKSSLTAALVSSGFSYVTDELLLVDLHAETLKGAPLAIGLKPGSWDLIKASCPAIEAMPAFERQDGKTIKYLRPPTLCRDYTLDSIGAIVFPSLREGDEASLHPLSAAETFFRLTDAGYDTHRRMSRKDVSLIFDWIGGIPAYELRYRGMDKAVQAISRLPLA